MSDHRETAAGQEAAVASLQRAIGELTSAARQKREFPGSFLAGTYTGFAVHHLREAAKHAPRDQQMRIMRQAASLRMTMRYTGRAPHDAALTVAATIADEIAGSIIRRGGAARRAA